MPPPSGGNPKLPLELNLPLIAPPETGSCWRMSPTEVRPVRSRSSRDSIRTGACLPSGSPMRDPVTTMTSPSVGGVSSAATGTSWAGGAVAETAGGGSAGASAGVASPAGAASLAGVVSADGADGGDGAAALVGATSGAGCPLAVALVARAPASKPTWDHETSREVVIVDTS